MRKGVLFSAIMSACIGTMAVAGEQIHWTYSGNGGPEHWGELDPKFVLCATGKNQSPVNLTGFVEADLAPIEFSYSPGGNEILNNGHTIQINYQQGSTIAVGGHAFELKQFHFHAPSENEIEGKSFPMEAHFVHADQDGNLAVVAVMLEEGAANAELEKAWQQMPAEGGKHSLTPVVLASALLPESKDYYRFDGSLTTPPCSEGVWWLVMKAPVAVSKAQIEEFAHAMHHPNNRPIQPIFARAILK